MGNPWEVSPGFLSLSGFSAAAVLKIWISRTSREEWSHLPAESHSQLFLEGLRLSYTWMERSNATKQFVQESGNLHLLKRLFLKHLTVKHMYAYIYKFSRRPRKHVKCTLHILHSGMVPPQLKRLRFLKLFQLEPRQKRRHVVRAMLRPWMPLLGQTTVFLTWQSTVIPPWWFNMVQLFSIFHVGSRVLPFLLFLGAWIHRPWNNSNLVD